MAELVDERWILLSPDSPQSDYVASAFRARGLRPPRPVVTTTSFYLREALLSRGDYLSAFLRSMVSGFPSIKVLPIDLGLTPQPVAIVTLKNRTLSAAVELFIQRIRSAARAMC